MPGSVVIPIPLLDKGTPHKGFIQSKPQKIVFSSRSHNVDFQFAKTFHKMQGQTCRRVTVDLNDRPFCLHVSFSGFLVSFTRVKDHRHWCRMPNQPGTVGIRYLTNLQPHPDLVTWLHSYDSDGNWSKQLCTNATDDHPSKQEKQYSRQKSTTTKRKFASLNDKKPPPKRQRIWKARK